ncbi:MAG: hypothetical protein GY724_01575 [Actinomycetia bacterium]|nr:hypothetical protein [Actinomycetes bacterium]MCP4221797.1 hypothetical protein [Actinomycetes bacterium]MCP5034373.1 hypothetical protein [Actinomycetes bacterium]
MISPRAVISAGADLVQLGSAVIRRPRLWGTTIAAARSHLPSSWWRRRPFMPLPDRAWMRFRIETAYGGDGSAPLQVDDVITWLEWHRRFPR